MKISLIAAMSENNVIGFNERLPWGSLPNDWENLFKVTEGKKMIMGRKSYDSEDRIASKSGNVVISRNADYQVELGFVLKNSLETALEFYKDEEEVFIIGGGEIFKDAIKIADCIHLTLVHSEFEGDAFFPEIDLKQFKIVYQKRFLKDEKHAFDYSFIVYERA